MASARLPTHWGFLSRISWTISPALQLARLGASWIQYAAAGRLDPDRAVEQAKEEIGEIAFGEGVVGPSLPMLLGGHEGDDGALRHQQPRLDATGAEVGRRIRRPLRSTSLDSENLDLVIAYDDDISNGFADESAGDRGT